MTRVCIFGAGAIGGHMAARLAHAGHCDLGVVARGETLRAIRRDGLRLLLPDGTIVGHPTATDDPASLGPQDYLILTVKAHQLPAVLPLIEPLIGPHTAIVPPTTGLPAAFLRALAKRSGGVPPSLDAEELHAMPFGQVLGMVCWIGAHVEAPGVVCQDGERATCMIGELDGTLSDRARNLAALLTDSGIPTPVRPTIGSDIWIKFVNSLCWNPVAVLTGATNGAIGADAPALATISRMMEEADALAEHLGLAITVAPAKRIAVTRSSGDHKMSMLQDMEHGRALEIEVLRRSIEAVKQMAGLETPTIDAILSLIALRTSTAHPKELNR